MKRQTATVQSKIRKAKKRLTVTFSELCRLLDADRGCFKGALQLRGYNKRLVLSIRCKSAAHRSSWTCAVLFDNQRIDGIDWEGYFFDSAGRRHHGFHRHCWDEKKMDADRCKTPLPGFDPQTVHAFLKEGFKLLSVETEEGEREDGQFEMSVH